MSSEEEKFTTTGVLVEFTTSAEALAAYRRAVEKAETDVLKAITGGDLQQAGNVPFFTPSPRPIAPEEYHNAFPPITTEGIQEAAKRLRELRAQWDKEDAENLAGVPMREPLPPRAPDLCPDDSQDKGKP